MKRFLENLSRPVGLKREYEEWIQQQPYERVLLEYFSINSRTSVYLTRHWTMVLMTFILGSGLTLLVGKATQNMGVFLTTTKVAESSVLSAFMFIWIGIVMVWIAIIVSWSLSMVQYVSLKNRQQWLHYHLFNQIPIDHKAILFLRGISE